MRNKILYSVSFSFLSLFCMQLTAQSQSRDGYVQFRDQSVPAFLIELPASLAAAKMQVEEKLLQTDARPKLDKEGFYKVSKIKLPQLNREFVDIYYKFNESALNEARETQVVLLISLGYENFISTQSDAATGENVHRLLMSIYNTTVRQNLQVEIDNQLKLLQKEVNHTMMIRNSISKNLQEKASIEAKLNKLLSDLDNQIKLENAVNTRLEELKKQLIGFQEKLKMSKQNDMD